MNTINAFNTKEFIRCFSKGIVKMRKIIGCCVERPSVIVLFFISLTIAGVLSYMELNKQEDPNFEVQQAVITTVYPGVGSEEVDEEVTTKIVDAINHIPEIDEVFSFSYQDVSIVHIILHDGSTVQATWDEIRENLDEVRLELPENAEVPKFDVDVAKTASFIVHLSTPDKIDFDIGREESEKIAFMIIEEVYVSKGIS